MAGKQIGVTLKFIDDFTAGFNTSIKALTDGTKNAQKLAKQIGQVGDSISKMGKALTVGVTMPIVGIGAKAVATAQQVQDAMIPIENLGNKVKENLGIAQKAMSNYSIEFGKDFSEIAQSYYTLASAFNDTSEVSKGLKTVMQLSTVGKTSADAAAKAVAVAFNAYGGNVQRIGDIIKATESFGFTTIAELGDSMASVTPTAQQLGMSIEDLYTSMAVITSTGVSTSEAVTYLKNALNSITKSGDRARIANGGFLEYLKDLKTEMPTVEDQMKKFTNIRARSGITALLGNLDQYEQYAKEISNCAGMLQTASNKVQNSATVQFAKTMQQLNRLLRQLGERLLPVINNALTKFNDYLSKINFSDAQVDSIIRIATGLATIGPALMGIGGAINAIKGGLNAFNTIKSIFSTISAAGGIIPLLASPLGIVLAVVAGIAAVAYIVWRNFDKIKPAIDRLLQALQPLLDILQIIGQVVFSAIGRAFDAVAQTIGDIFVGLIDSITMIFSGIGDILYGMFTGNFDLIGQGLLSIFDGIGSGILNVLLAPIRLIVSFVNGLIDGINKVNIKIPDWVPAIGGKDFSPNIPKIPSFASGIESFSGGFARINEQGGEIVNLPNGSRVIPHDVSMAMARTNQGTVINLTNNISSLTVREDADIDKIAAALTNKLVRAYVNS